MQNLRKKIDQKKRELEDLIVLLAANAKMNDHHPNFSKCDAYRKASEFVQKAASELYMAQAALMGDDR
jgi:hypothetical protein